MKFKKYIFLIFTILTFCLCRNKGTEEDNVFFDITPDNTSQNKVLFQNFINNKNDKINIGNITDKDSITQDSILKLSADQAKKVLNKINVSNLSIPSKNLELLKNKSLVLTQEVNLDNVPPENFELPKRKNLLYKNTLKSDPKVLVKSNLDVTDLDKVTNISEFKSFLTNFAKNKSPNFPPNQLIKDLLPKFVNQIQENNPNMKDKTVSLDNYVDCLPSDSFIYILFDYALESTNTKKPYLIFDKAIEMGLFKVNDEMKIDPRFGMYGEDHTVIELAFYLTTIDPLHFNENHINFILNLHSYNNIFDEYVEKSINTYCTSAYMKLEKMQKKFTKLYNVFEKYLNNTAFDNSLSTFDDLNISAQEFTNKTTGNNKITDYNLLKNLLSSQKKLNSNQLDSIFKDKNIFDIIYKDSGQWFSNDPDFKFTIIQNLLNSNFCNDKSVDYIVKCIISLLESIIDKPDKVLSSKNNSGDDYFKYILQLISLFCLSKNCHYKLKAQFKPKIKQMFDDFFKKITKSYSTIEGLRILKKEHCKPLT